MSVPGMPGFRERWNADLEASRAQREHDKAAPPAKRRRPKPETSAPAQQAVGLSDDRLPDSPLPATGQPDNRVPDNPPHGNRQPDIELPDIGLSDNPLADDGLPSDDVTINQGALEGMLGEIKGIEDPKERVDAANDAIDVFVAAERMARAIRKRAVADLLRSGMGVAETARTAQVSESTVKNVREAMRAAQKED